MNFMDLLLYFEFKMYEYVFSVGLFLKEEIRIESTTENHILALIQFQL